MASRGCPFKCTFCSLTAEVVRFRDVNSILDEIEEKIEITGSRYLRFSDSSFTLKKSWVTALCNGMIERKLNLKWGCYSRVDIDLNLLKLMSKAGLVSVEVAVESGSPKILETIKKDISITQFEKYIRVAYDLKIRVWCFLMTSFPGETREDAQMTLDLIRRNGKYIYNAGLQIARILPDDALMHTAKERGVLPKDFDWFGPYTIKYQNKDLLIKK